MRSKIAKVGLLLVTLILALSLVPGCWWGGTEEPTALTIVNGDTTRELTLSEIEAMTAVEGWGGRLKSDGVTVEGPYQYKGVSLVNLCDLVGGITSSNSVKVTAEDGYSMTFGYNQATASGGFTFFNAADPAEEIPVPSSYHVILAYKEGGELLPHQHGGPLRVCIVDSENQITEGHWWIKWVTRIEVQTGEEPWTLHLEGAINEDMDNGSFESGVNCHSTSYTDDKGEWTGIPLWYLVGWVDDEVSHGEGAFNDALADSGAYTVKVIAKDGFSYTFDSATVAHNDDIIVANKKDGHALGSKKWPLCLRGSGLTSGEMKVSQIDTIQLIFS